MLDATSHIPHSQKAPLALMIMVAVVGISALGILPIAISAVCGVLLLALTNCLGWKDMAQAVNTQIVLIVAASLALGFAMLETGAADAMAAVFINLTAGMPVTLLCYRIDYSSSVFSVLCGKTHFSSFSFKDSPQRTPRAQR